MKDNVKNWLKGLKRENITWGIIGIIAGLIMVGYFFGYRPEDIFLVAKKGTVSIELPLSNTNVFIDEVKKVTTSKENEIVEFSLTPRKHSVIISRDGYYPWTKQFTVPRKNKLTLSPIFVSVNTTGQIITNRDPEYQNIKRAIVGNKLPTKTSPIKSYDSAGTLWIDDNAILVSIASSTYSVIQPDTIIKSVDFYKNRSDAVIFSTSNAIFVIEVNKEGKQNFMPIYKGISPIFIKNTTNSIYVLDGTSLMEVLI